MFRKSLIVLLLACTPCFAQTKFVAGSVVEVPAGQSADLVVSPPEGSGILFKVSPSPLWKAPNLESRIIFNGLKNTPYTVDAQFFTYNTEKKRVEVREESLTLMFLGGISPVPPVPTPTPTPIDSPKAFYFMVIRANGPADPAFTKQMSDPAWASLRGRGHTIKDKTIDEAKAYGITAATVPSVATLVVSADGKSTSIYRPPVALPTTSADILKLAEGGK